MNKYSHIPDKLLAVLIFFACYFQDKLVATQEVRIKELEAAKSKLEKSIQNTNNQMAKHKKAAEELKQKCDGLEAQLASLRKVRGRWGKPGWKKVQDGTF